MPIVLIPCLHRILKSEHTPNPCKLPSQHSSELTLLSCTGNSHLNAELQLLGKRKDYSISTKKCIICTHADKLRHWSQALHQNPGVPLQLRLRTSMEWQTPATQQHCLHCNNCTLQLLFQGQLWLFFFGKRSAGLAAFPWDFCYNF